MRGPFVNEPVTRFQVKEERDRFVQALSQVRSRLGGHDPMILGGRKVDSGARLISRNPADPQEVVGTVALAGRKEADLAVEEAERAFRLWSRTDPEARVRAFFRLAAVIRKRKHELSAWKVLEIGQSWEEADAQTAEAIDFCEWYAREMMRLMQAQPLRHPADRLNEVFYLPMGVGAVIAPWNFPLAILVGTAVAPVVAGNTVVIKPSEKTPVIAARFMECVEEAGFPPGVFNLLQGHGSEVGETLVKDPRVRFINFTGSKSTGLHLYEVAAKHRKGQKGLKRVVAEMGGEKRPPIVTEDADLEAAAAGIAVSAFGFQGQKCSACSRAILHEAIYDQVLQLLLEQVDAWRIGPPEAHQAEIGPVADEVQFQRILDYIEIGRREGTIILAGGPAPGAPEQGTFLRPAIFGDVSPDARIAKEEIFGPVLAVFRARDFDHALAIANHSEYALTGAVYTSRGEYIERARREFHVGNLYINRKCTGALVGVEPFGGFDLSGTNAKAGGVDYLQNFLLAKSVSEAVPRARDPHLQRA